MYPVEFFVQVYYKRHVESTYTEGVVFSCNNLLLFEVKKTSNWMDLFNVSRQRFNQKTP